MKKHWENQKGQHMNIISVFGSARPQPGHPEYQMAYELGQLLAQAGYAVANGGYMGIMEAVSRGASELGGHVIGITCDEIEVWRPVQPNRWISQEIRYATLWERLVHVVTENVGIIAMPGGVGTLTEVALAWNQLQVQVIPPRPFVLVGELWQRTLDAFHNPEHLPESHRALIHLARTPREAVQALNDWSDANASRGTKA
jgi:uncharacterized protein (TIGR00725 family)